MDALGGPNTFGHFPVGWAHAMDTPLQWTTQIATHFGGTGRLLVNDTLVAEDRIDRTMGLRISLDETFDIGPNRGDPVCETCHVPFDFPGTLKTVAVKLGLGG